MPAQDDAAEVSDPLKSGGEPEPARGPGGRPPHEPTEERRRQVEGMAGNGLTNEQIARVMRIGETTLKKHYPEELARGGAMATALVGQSLYRMATDWMQPPGEGEPRKGPDKAAVAAAIFWMKARAGWSEKVKLEHSGDAANPLAVLLTRPTDELERRQREIDEALAAIEAGARGAGGEAPG